MELQISSVRPVYWVFYWSSTWVNHFYPDIEQAYNIVGTIFFCRTHSLVLFWDHWYPCFGFQSQSGFCLIHIANLLTDSIVGVDQVHILPQDITSTNFTPSDASTIAFYTTGSAVELIDQFVFASLSLSSKNCASKLISDLRALEQMVLISPPPPPPLNVVLVNLDILFVFFCLSAFFHCLIYSQTFNRVNPEEGCKKSKLDKKSLQITTFSFLLFPLLLSNWSSSAYESLQSLIAIQYN